MLTPYVTKTGGFTGVVPLGAGITMIYNSKINFGIELGGRFSLSDNLDVYTSAFPKSNDVYHLLNFTFTYKINTGNNGLPSFGK